MVTQQPSHDVVIIGGGPVGLTLALALVRAVNGIKVALVDRREFSVPRDLRASTLAAGVRRTFEQLGVWGAIAPLAEPVRKMKITDSGKGDLARPLFLTFDGDVAPGEPFAHLVPNTAVIAALLDAVAGKVELIAPAEIAGYSAEAGQAQLRLADGRLLTAPLLVAADGARSGMRQMAGIGTVGRDYHQSGIVTTIAHERDHEGTAYEHFRPAGPFASLPLPGRRSSLVWTETTAEAARIVALPKAEAEAEIEAAMGSALGAVTLEEDVQAYPLRLQLATHFVGPRLALVGDAAHVIHPIAGQGLNLGLKDVAALAELVVDAIRLGLDPGGTELLARYERWRRLDTGGMALVMDGLNRLFSNDLPPVRAARDFGLGVVDRLPPLKDFFISRAAAIETQGPKLLRGLPL
jgi:2-octaprenyl-6-methoxyphenol hydroxylase